MARAYYKATIDQFLLEEPRAILGELTQRHEFSVEVQQRNAWVAQIRLLQNVLVDTRGSIAFEYNIPRMGKRIDCVLVIGSVVFAIEFKVGASTYEQSAIDQVVDYAVDLKNFHAESHNRIIVPVLICTSALTKTTRLEFFDDFVAKPIRTPGHDLQEIISCVLSTVSGDLLDPDAWFDSVYRPTPTIVEAAQALYRGHSVHEISRSDAGAINLSETATAVLDVIDRSQALKQKSICFITGVPGAGKTLAGLNLANQWQRAHDSKHAVFLSGNGPLVDVLRRALAVDTVKAGIEKGSPISIKDAESTTKAFIQNIHHFRDDALETKGPMVERVVVFDEAQRAWTMSQTAKFMKTKKGMPDFDLSEPAFLIGVMDRHRDWGVIVCLVGGGQEINTGEAGLQEWFSSLREHFPNWHVYVSGKLREVEYTQGQDLWSQSDVSRIHIDERLHLSVSMRSFRSERVSAFVRELLEVNHSEASSLFCAVSKSYPIFVTRDIRLAKQWLNKKARGTERYGIVATSGAMRLRAFGIHVKASMDPVNWFLGPKSDVRSSYYLEDVATEFSIQGLELDWVCVAWDADLRFVQGGWQLKAFRGTSWTEIGSPEDRLYLKNAYRVLLTRARQGMVIFVPEGRSSDPTRPPAFYDGTYEYIRSLGVPELSQDSVS